VRQVFISSIQRGYEDVRDAVRRAVESLDMRPLMAEGAGAHAESPQRALLDLVARCDVFLLLIGPRYSRPTEDEFNEANRLGKPILVLRENGELEPEQQAFLERVAGGWSGGRMWGTYDGASDVALAAVKALANTGGRAEELAPAAQARAEALAGVTGEGGRFGSIARLAFAPLVLGTLLDAVALDRPGLADAIADLVRAHHLVDHSVGIKSALTRDGITISPTGSYANAPASALVAADGAVMCEINVAGDDQFGSSRVDPDRLRAGVAAAGAFALAVWGHIDEREEVQQVAVALAIPEAQHKVFGAPRGNKSTLSMGWGLPQIVAVPKPPAIVRRAEVAGDQLAARFVAEVKRVFADSNAVAG
jgi:hypothetical protein